MPQPHLHCEIHFQSSMFFSQKAYRQWIHFEGLFEKSKVGVWVKDSSEKNPPTVAFQSLLSTYFTGWMGCENAYPEGN